jgi:hypothetical protein
MMADGMQVEGVDYAWSRPNIAQLAAAGKVFACRYGGPGSSGKQLDPAEARALSAAGVAIVANAEGAADGLLGGWNAGVSWARDAEQHFAACGMPAGRPIYLSVDFDVASGQWSAVREALRGAASVIGASRVGVYGGRRAIEWARRDHVAAWFWQTYAWSSGVWVPGNHIEQYRNGVALAGATLDLDRALAADFGQWTIGDDSVDQYHEDAILYTDNRVAALIEGSDVVHGTGVAEQGKGAKVFPVVALKQLLADVEELKARPPVAAAPIDPAALAAALQPSLDALEARLRADTRDAVADLGEGGSRQVRDDG